MSRPLRIEFPGAFYHVFSQGNERKEIFWGPEDYKLFGAMLKECCEKYRVWLHGFCFMPNHYHLIAETDEANLSLFMKQLLGVYTIKFNWRHERDGHLFRGRYKALLVDKDAYLLKLSQYVHLNPCRSGLCSRPEEYPYSSLRNFLGIEHCPAFLKTRTVLSQFKSPEDYLRYVHSGLQDKTNLMTKVRGGLFLADQPFVDRFKEKILRAQTADIAGIREITKNPAPLLTAAARREPAVIQYYLLWRWGKMTHQKIAERYGVTRTAVSQAVRRLSLKQEHDENLRLKIERLVHEMSQG